MLCADTRAQLLQELPARSSDSFCVKFLFSSACPSLFRQNLFTFDLKFRFHLRSSGSRLSPSYSDAINAAGDNSISFFIDLAEVTRIQRKVDVLRFSRTNMDSRETA